MNIMILVNKDFEYAGYKAGVDSRIRANAVPSLCEIACDTGVGPDKSHISRMYKVGDNTIREYCISYLFPAVVNTSNSEMKYALVRNLINQEYKTNNIDLIVSVSTSETTGIFKTTSMNGCVLIGNSFYARDCSKNDSSTESHLEVKDNWNATDRNTISSKVSAKIAENKIAMAKGMIKPPNSSSESLKVISNSTYVSLGVINVMDYSCYKEADVATYEEYNKWNKVQPQSFGQAAVLETTHAVVKMASQKVIVYEKETKEPKYINVPVLFVSPIVDRYEHFGDDVDGKWGGQNLTSSYNAGVAMANLMECIIKDM